MLAQHGTADATQDSRAGDGVGDALFSMVLGEWSNQSPGSPRKKSEKTRLTHTNTTKGVSAKARTLKKWKG